MKKKTNKVSKKPVFKYKKKFIKKLEPLDETKVTTSKFLGYCPKCKGIIVSKDTQSTFIYICPQCNKRDRVKGLRKTIGNDSDKPVSKKDYLESVVHSKHYEHIPLNEEQLKPKDLKIQE